MADGATPNTAKTPAAPLSGTPADPFKDLNPQQRAAVTHGRAPLLVLAGAGSGKTLTLAARVARLVLDGADPQRLLLTFSRRAAQEMSRRAGRRLHQALGLRATQAAPSLPWAGTFHAVGARLLRAYAPAIGLPEQFSIIDRGDAEDLMGLTRQVQGLAAARGRTGAHCAGRSPPVRGLEPLHPARGGRAVRGRGGDRARRRGPAAGPPAGGLGDAQAGRDPGLKPRGSALSRAPGPSADGC